MELRHHYNSSTGYTQLVTPQRQALHVHAHVSKAPPSIPCRPTARKLRSNAASEVVPKDDDAFARRFLNAVQTGDYTAADQMLVSRCAARPKTDFAKSIACSPMASRCPSKLSAATCLRTLRAKVRRGPPTCRIRFTSQVRGPREHRRRPSRGTHGHRRFAFSVYP